MDLSCAAKLDRLAVWFSTHCRLISVDKKEKKMNKERELWCMKKARKPEWDFAAKKRDWRNYIPLDTQQVWDDICILGRMHIINVAEMMADAEGEES